MFLLSEQIKKEAQHIIADDIDNDILLIVAHNGVGKTKLLKEIYGSTAFNHHLIVSTGNTINSNSCSLRRCFAEGIIEYASRNNNKEVKDKINKRIKIPTKVALKALFTKILPQSAYGEALCKLSLYDLKSLYYEIAKGLPLVIISSAMVLTPEEIEYLASLDNDPFGKVGARITFVLGIRAFPTSIKRISKIINCRQRGVWLMPLMPNIETTAVQNDPHSMASISINDASEDSSKKVVDLDLLTEFLNNETYTIVRQFIDNKMSPQKIHILANQEISKQSYDYLQDITKEIYKIDSSQFEKGLILPYDNKLLWLDVLSYYFALQKNIDTIIQETQKFYFLLINRIVYRSEELKDVRFGKLKRNSFLTFIHEAEGAEGNNIADGYARYYSDFAKLTKALFSRTVYNSGEPESDLTTLGVLERITIDFSPENIMALEGIYGYTQICSVLDIGLETLTEFLAKVPPNRAIPIEIEIPIKNYINLCINEIYKWNDLTLVENLLDFLAISSKRSSLRLEYSSIVFREKSVSMANIINNKINERIKRGEIMMNAVEQNMINYWNREGETVKKKFQKKVKAFPVGNGLSQCQLDKKLSQCEIIVLTANPVENAIVTQCLMKSCKVANPEKITADAQTYQFFTLKGHPIVHIVPQRTSSYPDHGSLEAIYHALQHIVDNCNNKLKAIFSIGVAYGMFPNAGEDDDKQDIGDVLVSDRIIRWDAFIKITNGDLKLDEHDSYFIGDDILGGCKQYLQQKDAPKRKKVCNSSFRWFLGAILSGNAVLSDSNFKHALLCAAEKQVAKRENIVGGEMEGSGVWLALQLKKSKVPFMIIKGICDWGENKNGWGFVSEDVKIQDLIKDCVQAQACVNAYKSFEFIVGQVYGTISSVKEKDKEILRFYVKCFNRGAFKNPIENERIDAFGTALNSVQTAIRTGTLVYEAGATVIKDQGSPYTDLANRAWAEKMHCIDQMIEDLKQNLYKESDGLARFINDGKDVKFEGPVIYDWFDEQRDQILDLLNSMCKEAGIRGVKSFRHS